MLLPTEGLRIAIGSDVLFCCIPISARALLNIYVVGQHLCLL